MNEDVLNMEVRKFLKLVGVTSQRVIEAAVRDGLRTGALGGEETIAARMTLSIDRLGVRHEIDGNISLK